MTAAQLANMLCEAWAGPAGPARADRVAACFAESVRVAALDSDVVLQSGRAAVHAAAAAADPWPAEAALSLFMEPHVPGADGDDDDADGGGATLALHVYEPGRAPGFGPGGVGAARHDGRLSVLYAAAGGAVRAVWVAEGGPAAATGGGCQAALEGWGLWGRLRAVGRAVLGPGEAAMHCNDYGESEDRLGLGLATVSRSESWHD